MPNFVVLVQGRGFNGLGLVQVLKGLTAARWRGLPGLTRNHSALSPERDFNGLGPARSLKVWVVA